MPVENRGTGTEDSAWEEDASTTVEQGEVADKLGTLGFNKRAPNNPGHTQTGTGLEEPTVAEPDSPELSTITPLRADNNVARLIITQGNDAGQEIELRPNKPHTIGRGLDNDVVLTDIAVSRKHFDLKFADGAWIISDHGSGNGTVVNGNVEDNPFMLASGDLIEIGNTVFRFEQPNGAPRSVQQHAYDNDNDADEEMSTVAGKPVRLDDPPPPPSRRPKTMPPPIPLRSANASAAPPLSSFQPAAMSPPSFVTNPPAGTPPQPASTLPMPQMANRPPLVGPHMPTMMGDAMGMPMPPHQQLQGSSPQLLHEIPHLNGGLAATTLTGQGPPVRPSYPSPYPQAAEIPQHSVHAQMLMIQQTQGQRRDGSTAHVPPSPYDPMLGYVAAPRQPRNPVGTKRTKLAIAGIGLALLTGVVTAALVKSGSSKGKPAVTAKKDTGKATTKDAKTDPKTAKTDPKATKPTAEPITSTKPTAEPIATAPKAATPTGAQPTTQPATQPTTQPTTQPAKIEPKVEPKTEAKVDPPKVEPKAEPKVETKIEAKVEPKATPKVEKKVEPKAEKKGSKREARREPSTPPANKRVATATDTSAARDKAENLYKARKFSEAASVLAAAAKTAPDDEASELRQTGDKYNLLGKALAKGTAPAQKAADAYKALTQALNLDNNVGGNFKAEISEKLNAIAPKAAVAFVAQKDYGNARSAYLTAQRASSTDANLAIVKQKLESFASELYALASAEATSNPGPAKEKLKQIKQIVDPKSPTYVKAQALLNKL